MMNWNDNLAVGVNSIDNQHKELFSKINDLLVAMKSGNGNNEIFKMLNFLENYVTKHFNDEESIQRKNNYPGYNIQHEQHESSVVVKIVVAFDQTFLPLTECISHAA
jgi:hemerythrin